MGPAVEDFRFASQHLPNRPDAYYQLALGLAAAQKRDEARLAADKAAGLAPEWAEARDLATRLRR